MSTDQQKCKLDTCDVWFTPKTGTHKFHAPKCKAEYHRRFPMEKYPTVTVIESKTGKGGIDSIVRCSLADREKMAKIVLPGKRFKLVPETEDLF